MASSTRTEPPRTPGRGIAALVRTHGAPLALYYFIFNECCVLVVTFLLQYDYLAADALKQCVTTLRLDRWINLNAIQSAELKIGPVTISGKFAANFSVATAFMSLWTPLQIPFCVATLPYLRRLIRLRRRPV